MPAEITIGGEKVALAWTQDAARRFAFRASSIGGGPSFTDFTHPVKAESAVTTFLWLVLPAVVHARYPRPEDLYSVISEEEAPGVHAGIMAVIAEMNPTKEEKKTSPKTHSPESNSD